METRSKNRNHEMNEVLFSFDGSTPNSAAKPAYQVRESPEKAQIIGALKAVQNEQKALLELTTDAESFHSASKVTKVPKQPTRIKGGRALIHPKLNLNSKNRFEKSQILKFSFQTPSNKGAKAVRALPKRRLFANSNAVNFSQSNHHKYVKQVERFLDTKVHHGLQFSERTPSMSVPRVRNPSNNVFENRRPPRLSSINVKPQLNTRNPEAQNNRYRVKIRSVNNSLLDGGESPVHSHANSVIHERRPHISGPVQSHNNSQILDYRSIQPDTPMVKRSNKFELPDLSRRSERKKRSMPKSLASKKLPGCFSITDEDCRSDSKPSRPRPGANPMELTMRKVYSEQVSPRTKQREIQRSNVKMMFFQNEISKQDWDNTARFVQILNTNH